MEVSNHTYGLYHGTEKKSATDVCLIISSTKYGIENPLEIDILCRMCHPNLLWAKNIFTPRDAQIDELTLVVPAADYSLKTYIESKRNTTLKKIPIVWKIANAIHYLHKNRIAHCGIKLESFSFSNGEIYLGGFEKSCLVESTDKCENDVCERGKNNKMEKILEDIISFGKICFYIFTEKRYNDSVDLKDFEIIDPKYRQIIYEFVNKTINNYIDENSEIGTPFYTLEKLLSDDLFSIFDLENVIEYDCIRNDYDCDYRSEHDTDHEGHVHREILKNIVAHCKNNYNNINVKLLFIIIDLFKRTDAFLTSKSIDLRTFNAYVCVYLALKLMGVNTFSIEDFCKNVLPEDINNYGIEKFKLQEFEITRLTKGCYLDLYLYRSCKNFEQLYETFHNVIMSKECDLYKNIDKDDWFIKLEEVNKEDEMIETSILTFLGE